MDLECSKCHRGIVHQCHSDIERAARDLFRWVPEHVEPAVKRGIEEAAKESGWGFERDDPFFGSQGWSYAMFGKEDARTFHALLHNLLRSAGLDPNDIFRALGEEARKTAKVGDANDE